MSCTLNCHILLHCIVMKNGSTPVMYTESLLCCTMSCMHIFLCRTSLACWIRMNSVLVFSVWDINLEMILYVVINILQFMCCVSEYMMKVLFPSSLEVLRNSCSHLISSVHPTHTPPPSRPPLDSRQPHTIRYSLFLFLFFSFYPTFHAPSSFDH